MKDWKFAKDMFLIATIILITAGLFYLNNKENPAMLGFTPHPFFVISILIAAFYGFRHSVFSSTFSTGLYFILLHTQIDYDEVESIVGFEYISMPLSMIFISMLVGELKQRTIRDLGDANKEILEKDTLIDNLERKIDIGNKEVGELKQRLVSKLETMEEIYDIGLGLYKNNIDELFPNFLVILHKHLGVEGASIYIKSKSKLNDGKFKLAKGFPFSDEFPIQINSFSTDDILFRKAFKNQKLMTVRDVSSKEEFEAWGKQTVISVPVVVGNEVHAIVNIHNIPFLKYTPTTFKKLELLVRWLSQSLQYAMNYEGYSKYSVLDETLHIYKNDYFHERLEEELVEADKYNTPLSVVKLSVEKFETVSEVKKVPYKKILSDVCLRMTRRRDCVAEGDSESEFLLIIPNLNEKGGEEFKKRIEGEIKKFNLTSEAHTPLEFGIKSYFVSARDTKASDVMKGLH